jgi:single-strand DNA-binding protein
MPLPQVTIEGNLGADPELRFAPSGSPFATFRVGTSERKFNRDTNQWEDGRNCWMSVVVWRDLAENVAESLHKGDNVIVTGVLYDRTYDKEGTQHTVTQMEAKTVSPSLARATAQIHKASRTNAQGQPVWGQGAGSQPSQQAQQGQQDPWATPATPAPTQTQPGWGGAPPYDEPPF